MQDIDIAIAFTCAALCLLMATYAYGRRREVPQAQDFCFFLLSISFWMFSYGMAMASRDVYARLIWWRLRSVGFTTMPVSLLVFALRHTMQMQHVSLQIRWLLYGLSVILIGFVFTNEHHRLVWTTPWKYNGIEGVNGPLYYAMTAYAYLLLAGGLVVLVYALASSIGAYRQQTALLVLGLLAPMTLNLVYEIFDPDWMDAIPVDTLLIGMLFTSLMFFNALFRQRLLLILPVAQKLLMDNLRDGVLVTDHTRRLVFSNQAAQHILMRRNGELLNHDLQSVLLAWGQLLCGDLQPAEGEAHMSAVVNGERREYTISITPLRRGRPGILLGSMIMLYDVTDRKQLERRLERLATIDYLTGMLNRRQFLEQAENELAAAQRNRQPLAILMLDLDHFKRVNDLFGHKAGDFALQAIATAWKFEIRQNDYICRYGGEEFAILLPETNLESALLAAERLRSAVMQLSLTEVSAELRLTVSIGVAVLSDPDNQTIDLVIERADLALYQSKQNGRNRVSAWENEQLDLFRAAACGYIEDDCCRQHGASHHILVGNANAH